LDDLIKDARGRKGLGSAEAEAIIGTQADFLKWAEGDSKVPGYAKARKQFQKDSQVIDRMVVGRALKSKLFQSKTPLAELKGNAFLSALEEELKTIKRSTGDTRYKKSFRPFSLLRTCKLSEKYAKPSSGVKKWKTSSGLAQAQGYT